MGRCHDPGRSRHVTTAYVIATNPRTGSNWLCELLRGTGVAGRPDEYFWNPPSWRERWAATTTDAYLKAMYAEGTTANGVFGIKVMWAETSVIREMSGKEDEADALEAVFPGARYIRLGRKDRLRQAISQARALQTGRWRSTDQPEPGPPTYDRRQIGQLVAYLTDHDARWDACLASAGIKPLQVWYEELASEPERELERILEFLDLQGGAVRFDVSLHRRQADALTDEWVQRFTMEERPGRPIPDCHPLKGS